MAGVGWTLVEFGRRELQFRDSVDPFETGLKSSV